MLHLHVQPAESEPFERRLAKGSWVLGRAADVDVLIADRFLSRHHARLYERDGGWWVEDLGSLNGTLVDGVLIDSPAPVRPGTVLILSESRVEIRATDAEPLPSPTAAPRYLEAPTVMLSASDLLAQQAGQDPASLAGEAEVRLQAERLKLLNEVHRALGRSLAQEELLEMILDRLFAHLRPDSGLIFLTRSGGRLEVAASRPEASEDPKVDEAWLRQVAEEGLAVVVDDAEEASHPSGRTSEARSRAAVPLLDDRGSLGVILLTARPRAFSRQDLELLVSLASVAALALRNAALAQEAAERRRLEGELDLARRIQLALLPERPPEIPGWELHAGNLPSRRVSGDFYQVLPRNGGEECVLMLADVAGKGIGASLLTATLEALAAAPLEEGRPPDEVCTRLCRQLYRRTPPERFATIFLAVLEVATGTLRWTSAGHNPPLLLRRSGDTVRLPATGPPLGLVPEVAYPLERITLDPGDLLVLFTDGIVEVENPQGEIFGDGRIEAVCRRHQDAPLPHLAAALERETETFAAGAPFEDDRTVVLLRRRA